MVTSPWKSMLLQMKSKPRSRTPDHLAQVKKKNTGMSNIFPRERGKPSESIFILNVTNLSQEKTNGVLLWLLVWNP